MTVQRGWITILLVALAVGAYFLPWIWHPAAGLSPGGRDLAEWTTLHPEARSGSLVLLPSFLLRVAFGLAVILLALTAATHTHPYIRRATYTVAFLLALTLFPPLDFVTTASGDPNYRQQFTICAGTLIALGLVVWRGAALPSRMHAVSVVLIAGCTVGCELLGLAEGLRLMGSLGVALTVGRGGLLFAVLIAAAGLVTIVRIRNSTIRADSSYPL